MQDCEVIGMSERIYMNDNWFFTEQFHHEMNQIEYDVSKLEKVRIPHTFRELPFHYFDESLYQMEGGYRKHFVADASWKGQKVFITFEGSAHDTEVFLDGKLIGAHHCGYTGFSIEISKELHYDKENILVVRVDSRETLNIPPFGDALDYMSYGGIYRDVYLELKPPAHIKDLFLKPEVPIDPATPIKLITEIESELDLGLQMNSMKLRQYYRKKPEQEFSFLGEKNITKDAHKNIVNTTLSFFINSVDLWSPETPVLYEIMTQLVGDDEVCDEFIVYTGFRNAEFRKDGFYLNGHKRKLLGLNRHQSYPYVGYAMPDSMQIMDANIMKYELGLNAVRTSHYPQSHAFINRCDEIGLLVFMEIPGWQYIGDETWKNQAIKNTQDMVKQYRNHTSIILWGVRINESKDDDKFYKRTNEAAKRFDNTRATAGVRAHKNSSLLEDVYTYNDFVHTGRNQGCQKKEHVTSDCEKPYLVSEYNGHMYPTKAFDSGKHRTEHAIRHATVINAIQEQTNIGGGFGWCFSDYNTHKDFGSGDRICYHGVLDMFRNSKLAADVYAAQQDEFPVLTVTSSLDIGEQPAGIYGKEWVITNADEVRMYKNNRLIKCFKKESSPFKSMKHGPILLDDFVGKQIDIALGMKTGQKKLVSRLLNDIARYGISGVPKTSYLTMIMLMIVYRMKLSDISELYGQYIGNWGGIANKYRFDAVKNGNVVKSIKKAPMNTIQLDIRVSHRNLIETHSYDVAAIRIRAVDENGNLLSFFHGALKFELEGPLKLIGPSVVSLQGGMGGTYVKTTGVPGEAILRISNEQIHEIKEIFHIQVE